MLGYQIGAAWRKMDRTMDLYVMAIVSDCWPHVVPARAFRIFSRGVARVTKLEIWWPKVKWGSRVTPSRRGCLSRGRGVLLRRTVGCVLDCCLSEVKSVTDDLGAERESPRSSAHSETRAACSVRAEAATL